MNIPVVFFLSRPGSILEICLQVFDRVVHLFEPLLDGVYGHPGGGVEVEDLLVEAEQLGEGGSMETGRMLIRSRVVACFN